MPGLKYSNLWTEQRDLTGKLGSSESRALPGLQPTDTVVQDWFNAIKNASVGYQALTWVCAQFNIDTAASGGPGAYSTRKHLAVFEWRTAQHVYVRASLVAPTTALFVPPNLEDIDPTNPLANAVIQAGINLPLVDSANLPVTEFVRGWHVWLGP
jgi:hypothetical protein